MAIEILAKSVPTILTALGGVGYLAGISGAGILLTFGIVFHGVWLVRYFI